MAPLNHNGRWLICLIRWEVFAQTCEWDGNLWFTHTMDKGFIVRVFFLLCNARVEKRSRGFHVNPEEEPSNPLHQLDCQGGFHLKPRGRTQASLDCRAIAHLVWHGGVSRNPNDERHGDTRLGLFFLFSQVSWKILV